MKIEPIQDGCLRVWLTEDELQQEGLLKEEPSQRRLRRLVRRALHSMGRSPTAVVAELIPVLGGGVLLITPKLYPEAGQPTVYRLADEDALLALWERWPREEPVPVCSLYELEGEYRLAVHPTQPMSEKQMHLLLEYGLPLPGGEGAVAHAAEYGQLVGMGYLLTEREPRPPVPSDLSN